MEENEGTRGLGFQLGVLFFHGMSCSISVECVVIEVKCMTDDADWVSWQLLLTNLYVKRKEVALDHQQHP